VIPQSVKNLVLCGYWNHITFAPVVGLEVVRLLFAFACMSDFKVFQMDVKSVFLNGFINEEVYVFQPLGFEDHKLSDHFYNLKRHCMD